MKRPMITVTKNSFFSGFLEHMKKNGRWEVLVSWDGVGYESTWEPLSHMKKLDPISCAMYAKDKNLLDTAGWKWARKICTMDSSRLIRLSRRICKASRNTIKYKF